MSPRVAYCYLREVYPGEWLKDRIGRRRRAARMRGHHRRRLEEARRTGKGPGQIACIPGPVHPRAMIWMIAAELGLEVGSDPAGADAVLFWQEDPTSPFHKPSETLRAIALERPVVNLGATDISKTTVARAHEDAFDYPLLIDPLEHRGPAVEKPEGNGLRQARIVECPTEPVPGFTYQRLVDNRLDEDWTEDLRPVVVGNEIVCLIRKVRQIEARLGQPVGGPTRPSLHEPTDYLTGDEIGRILDITTNLGADYCEVDCVRDRASSLLYAVDVNTTPAMFDRLAPETRERMIAIEARAFAKAYLDGSPSPAVDQL